MTTFPALDGSGGEEEPLKTKLAHPSATFQTIETFYESLILYRNDFRSNLKQSFLTNIGVETTRTIFEKRKSPAAKDGKELTVSTEKWCNFSSRNFPKKL